MRGFGKHERRWGSDTVATGILVSEGSSPGTDTGASSTEEFVEVTLDLQDDDTIILRSVEPATFINIDNSNDVVSGFSGMDTPATASAPVSASRSPTMRRSSSNRLLQFSQELKAEAVAKARHFSQELKAELKRFSWSHGNASRILSSGASGGSTSGLESALAARAIRRQRAQLDRTRSGAQKALQGLKFISNGKNNHVKGWNEVQNNFDKLGKDGFLHRADFAQCIG